MRQSVTSKRPRAQPRARVKTRMAEGSVMSHDENVTASTSPITSSSTHSTIFAASSEAVNDDRDIHPSVSPTYVARLPSHAEFVQLLKTTFPFFTFSCHQRHPASQLDQHLPNKPWATHTLLTRVKFELALAYTLVQVHRHEMIEQHGLLAGKKSGVQNLANFDGPDPAFAKSIEDGSFSALVDEIFASEGRNEDEERMLFRDVLKSVAGLPLAEGIEGDMITT